MICQTITQLWRNSVLGLRFDIQLFWQPCQWQSRATLAVQMFSHGLQECSIVKWQIRLVCVPVFWWGRGLSSFWWLLERQSLKVNDYARNNSTVPSQQSYRSLIPWCLCFSFPGILSSCFKIKGWLLIIFMIRNSILQTKKEYIRWRKYSANYSEMHTYGYWSHPVSHKYPNRVAIAGGTCSIPANSFSTNRLKID